MSCSCKNNFVISADISDSHITAAIVDLNKKVIIDHTHTRLEVNFEGTSVEILETWAEALKQAVRKFDFPVYLIALAISGPFDYEHGISLIKGLHKYEAIYGLNIKRYLSEELNVKPENILLRNDAEAFLHGEVVAGAGAGYRKVIGITLGNSLGSAKSSLGVTKELNLGISKFNNSIVDDYLSIRFFIKRYFELTGKSVPNVKALAEIAENGGKEALLIFKVFTYNLCFFLKDFINAEKADVVVIGGNITQVSRLFFKPLIDEMAGYFEDVEIKIAQLDKDSALIGAAAAFDVRKDQSTVSVLI